jgi:four helix bundle protein
MARIEKIEDIVVWQNAVKLCDAIYDVTDKNLFAKDYSLKDQIRRSAISIPSNIAEGFERESNRQFVYFLLIAKGSAGELKTQLHISRNRGYISEEEFQKLHDAVSEISKQLGKFISYLRESIKQSKLSQLSKLS